MDNERKATENQTALFLYNASGYVIKTATQLKTYLTELLKYWNTFRSE